MSWLWHHWMMCKILFWRRTCCKGFFFGSPTWSMAERDREALISIWLAKMLWACSCYCGKVKFKGSFLEVKEKGKIWVSFLNHHHHHVVPPARISLTLSHHFSQLFIASGRSSGYILCPHIAAVCMFELVVLFLLGHMWGSIGVNHLWALPCFSSSVLHVTHRKIRIYGR